VPNPQRSEPAVAASGPSPSTAEPEPAAGESAPIDWAALPAPVAARLVELAADAVGGMPQPDVPASLRAVARFAPAKRAKLGGPRLLSALAEQPAFRAAVLHWAREHRPAALDDQSPDPVPAAAAATLLGSPDAVQRLQAIAVQATDLRIRAERDLLQTRVARLTGELERVREELASAIAALEQIRGEREAELERLRGRLRDQGVRVRAATDDAAAARAELATVRAELADELAAARLTADRERERAEAERRRADRAENDAEVARQAAREARAADEVRLALLVDTLAGTVTGLRRELALGESPRSGPRPADLIRGASRVEGGPGRVEDPAALDRLLALPSVHLVVDGYNVTKTGYSELTLSDQRDRLVNQLGALAARTGAEVTAVFDGAGVVAVPTAAPRGVRVLFSEPGVLADDVIRAVVAAEPEGRPVVVVTSDRAVAESVRRRGAHPVPSAVLLARFGRV
jgi:predicted RNA-binding protein with PIN domain